MITKEEILLAEAVVAEMEERDERVYPPPTQPKAVTQPPADVAGDKIAAPAITHRSAPLSPNGAEFSSSGGGPILRNKPILILVEVTVVERAGDFHGDKMAQKRTHLFGDKQG